MPLLRHFVLALPALLLAGAALARPVEVTRFHTPATVAQLGPGWVTVTAAPGIDGASLETRAWLAAVTRVLSRHGFADAGGASASRVVEARLTRDIVAGRGGGPVGVGVGVGAGSGRWHGGTHVGLGVGLGLGGRRGETVASELSVVIRDSATRAPLWEGRAVTRSRAGSREAAPAAVAERLARALFAGFPGRSGETIEVR